MDCGVVLIASTIAAPVYGRLGDAFGRRRLMFVALAAFSAASVLCAASPTIELLTFARLLQGLGGGGLHDAIAKPWWRSHTASSTGSISSYLAAVAVCANTFGPIAGGYLTEHFGWQSIFLINVPIGIVAGLLTRGLPNRVPENRIGGPIPQGCFFSQYSWPRPCLHWSRLSK